MEQVQVNRSGEAAALLPAAGGPPSSSEGAPSVGNGALSPPIVPDHDLLGCIGRGSYGEVWLARNVLGELRAVKIIYRSRFADPRPFEREFEGIQRFEPISRSHPSQLAILHVGKSYQAGCFYYVMELADGVENPKSDARSPKQIRTPKSEAPVADGEFTDSTFGLASDLQLRPAHFYLPHTLRHDLERQGRLPTINCVQIGLALTTALAHLHTHKLVHRDIKPSNVIFVDGVPKLGDIGLVTEAGDTQSIVGTEGYIPPEGPGTPQADIFSLGKVLYEISTGMDRRRFPELPENLRAWPDRSAVVEFNEIVLKACAKDPARRYPSAGEMRLDLELLRHGASVQHRRALQRGWAICKKGCLGIGCLVLVALAGHFSSRDRADSQLHSVNPEAERRVKRGDLIAASSAPERLAVAVSYFEAAIKEDPRFVPAYINLFSARLGQLSAAGYPSADAVFNLRAAATNLIKVAPTLAEAQIAASELKWLDGLQDEALEAAKQATKMEPASREGRGFVHELYGWMLLNTGNQTRSLQEYLLAESYNPRDATIELQLGNHYFVEHDYRKALEHLDKSIEVDDRQFWAYWCKGCVYEEMTNYLQAIDEFERADATTGKNDVTTQRSYSALRAAFTNQGSAGYWNERLRQERAAIQPEPHQIAVIFAHMGQTNEAYKYLEQACNERRLDGLWFDPCWDRSDPRFKMIAQKLRSRP